jgi:hypothetical protein
LQPTAPNTWAFDLDPGPPPAGGIKFIIVHLQGLDLPANNRVEIDLGYDKDVITAATGAEFWSRPVNLSAFASGKVAIRYITDGAANGSVTLDRFGRGERHDGDGDPTSNSNCDPFLIDANYAEPAFNTSLFCATPPDFENVDCVTAAGDVRKTVAPSVGMIVHVDFTADGNTEILSSISATLVGPDLVLTTAQNFVFSDIQLQSSSIIFNYEATCPGARPANYAGRFHKVKRIVKLGFFGAVDYALIQLSVPAAGLGIPPIVMRTDLPAAGEQIFCIHHPEGAVKRLSAKHAAFRTVVSSIPTAVIVDLDVASGSTGAGLFDANGQVVGVMSTGTPCNIAFYPTTGALADIGNQVDDPIGRDVMIVIDRSGSMSLDGGAGRSKIDEARDAASLFIQLAQGDGANQIGLVSFSTAASNPVDFALQPVNAVNKLALTGPAPFTTGIVGGLVAGGATSIGGGLQAAHDQMPVVSSNFRSVLLLTDGLQNTAPLIADVAGLEGIDINAIGFGAASSLNGALLTQLSETHNGLYVRADDGLDLKKYFSLAFGNIFAAGALLDPEGQLKAHEKECKPIHFHVCGEKTITIVVGWDKVGGALAITAQAPGGATITSASPGVEHATGRTWAFLRIKLPPGGLRNGIWSVTVSRTGYALEQPALRYFVNVIAGGGAKLTRWPGHDLYFTGDAINPVVRLAGGTGLPKGTKVTLNVRRPAASAGTVLTQAKRAHPPARHKGDTLPARQTTMLALEKAAGKPLIDYSEHRFELSGHPTQTNVRARSSGLFGAVLKQDFLNVEGTYTFHAVATFGGDCIGTREMTWSVEVDPGIDQARSEVKITTGATLPDKKQAITVVIIPRDSFGNYVGPGLPNAFTVSGTSGTTLTGAVRDNGDGSYTIAGVNDPAVGKPGVVLARPVRCICKTATRPGARPRKR